MTELLRKKSPPFASRFRVLAVFMLVVGGLATRSLADEYDVDQLLDGVLAREGMIATGVFEYQFGRGTRDLDEEDLIEPNRVDIRLFDAVRWTDRFEELARTNPAGGRVMRLVLSGPEWAITRASRSDFYSKHGGDEHLEYQELFLGEDDTRPGTLTIKNPTSSWEGSIDNRSNMKVFRASMLPRRRWVKYVESNRDRFESKGVVRLEDGSMPHMLEAKVLKKNFGTLSRVECCYSSFDHAIVRLYVLPEKGFAVRRLDVFNPDESLCLRYDSVGFKEVAGSIHLPEYYLFFDADVSTMRLVAHVLRRTASNVNEPIPEELLDFKLKPGTRIADYRDGRKFVTQLPEEATALGIVPLMDTHRHVAEDDKEVEEPEQQEADSPPEEPASANWTLRLVFAVVGLALVLGAFFARGKTKR